MCFMVMQGNHLFPFYKENPSKFGKIGRKNTKLTSHLAYLIFEKTQ